MSIFKKHEVVSTEGTQENVVMYSYLIYNRSGNEIEGSIKLTEDQANGLNAYFKSINIDDRVSFIRS